MYEDESVDLTLRFTDGPNTLDEAQLEKALSSYLLDVSMFNLDDSGHRYEISTFWVPSSLADVESLEVDGPRLRAVVDLEFHSLLTEVDATTSDCSGEIDFGTCLCEYQGAETSLRVEVASEVMFSN